MDTNGTAMLDDNILEDPADLQKQLDDSLQAVDSSDASSGEEASRPLG
jgi:hypothetical protein